jgi:hypothetical protein
MFGIPDYYDYSYAGVNYVGCLDMQSHNVFDWNSWSKFSVGWSKAYVVDGSLDTVTISLKSAALYNECIVVPSDVSTYNNSAFDEFFLIELFTKDGNNASDWGDYLTTAANIDAGIRLYHVDGRLVDFYSQRIIETKEDLEETLTEFDYTYIETGVNNSYNHEDYSSGGNYEWRDYKLLALIQKGGVDTFGNPDDNNGREDLLKPSDCE